MGKTKGLRADRHRVESEPFAHEEAAAVLNAEQAESPERPGSDEMGKRKESFAEFVEVACRMADVT